MGLLVDEEDSVEESGLEMSDELRSLLFTHFKTMLLNIAIQLAEGMDEEGIKIGVKRALDLLEADFWKELLNE